MKVFENIVQIGRKMGGTRGGEIQLEDNNAYLTNVKRSSLYHFITNEHMGTGTFYASQALLNSEKIQRRDEKVLFEWKEKGINRRAFVPNLDNFKEILEKRFKEQFIEPDIAISNKLLSVLQDLLITRLQIKDNKLIIKQARSDGSVGFENEIPLSSGMITKNYQDTDEFAISTKDLTVLSLIVENTIRLGLHNGKHISVEIPFSQGTVKALIGVLEYD